MSGGVVFAQQTFPIVTPATNSLLGRYGVAQSLTAGAVIPPGVWLVEGDYTTQPPTGAIVTTTGGGLCFSDGMNCKKVAAGRIISIGA